MQPDIIVTKRGPATAAVQRETRTIPIVFVNGGDPVASGIVARLDRPSGNVTGFDGPTFATQRNQTDHPTCLSARCCWACGAARQEGANCVMRAVLKTRHPSPSPIELSILGTPS